MNCPRCQKALVAGSAFCTGCGSPTSLPSRPGQACCAVHPEVAAVKTCPRCGNFTCVQCLVSLPGAVELCRRCEQTGLTASLPWDQREELGTLKAWWQTCLMILKAPTATFAQAPREGSLGSSLLFGGISSVAGIFSTALLYGLVLGVALAVGASKSDGPFEGFGVLGGLGMGLGIFLGYMLLVIVGGTGWLMMISALDHLALKAVKAEPASWNVSVRAGALAMAPHVVGLIPVCGLYVFPIWSLVLKVFAYRALHRTSGGKAAAGALIPIGAMMVLTILLYAVLVIGMLAFAGKR